MMSISDPPAYGAKRRGGNADNPTFHQASMNGPAVEVYIQAMKIEIETLVAQCTRDPVARTANMNVLIGKLHKQV